MAKRIKQVLFYQGVPFEGPTIKYFTPDENLSDGVLKGKGLQAEVEEKGVRIFSPKADVLVPWNNVACVTYYLEDKSVLKKVKV
jgi:hypothetical protein